VVVPIAANCLGAAKSLSATTHGKEIAMKKAAKKSSKKKVVVKVKTGLKAGARVE
jgi:hypothetical protein